MEGKFCANSRANCCKPAKFVCGRCENEFYCGKACQQQAFSKHRMYCFVLPDLLETTHVSNYKEDLIDVETAQEVPAITSLTAKISVPKVQTEAASVKVTEGQSKVPSVKAPSVVKEPVVTKSVAVPEVAKEDKPISLTFNRKSPASSVAAAKPLSLPPAGPPRIKQKDLPYKPIPKEKYKVSLINGNQITKTFFVSDASVEVSEFLQHIETAIAEYAKKAVVLPYKPVVDEVILAKYEGSFCRAVCKSVGAGEFTIQYIDYGDTAVLKDSDIIPITEDLMYEVVVNECYLTNFPDNLEKEHLIALEQGCIEIEGATKNADGYGYKARVVGF